MTCAAAPLGRDPEDWEWWFHDDFDGGSYEPSVLNRMHEIARQAEDPNAGPTPTGGVLQLTDICLTLGFVSLAAVQALRSLEGLSDVARRRELWAVSGHPDEVYGIILGRLTDRGFEPFAQP